MESKLQPGIIPPAVMPPTAAEWVAELNHAPFTAASILVESLLLEKIDDVVFGAVLLSDELTPAGLAEVLGAIADYDVKLPTGALVASIMSFVNHHDRNVAFNAGYALGVANESAAKGLLMALYLKHGNCFASNPQMHTVMRALERGLAMAAGEPDFNGMGADDARI